MDRSTRREFLKQLAIVPAVAHFAGAAFARASTNGPATEMASVDPWTATAFLVNGEPRFLAAGSMDYYRCPQQHWRDRLLKAKRAGLNTLMTYVAWNMHEPEEGTFVFNGISDLRRYLEICAELQMMAIVRVGPFICDEWEAGGYPAWLIGKPGAEFRIRSSVVEPYLERWLEQLCAQISPMQTKHGGPLMLVQAENEYYYAGRPGGAKYLTWLHETLKKFGIEVPISGCGNGDEVQVPGALATVNGYGGKDGVAGYRRKHPAWPLLISEHYTDWMDCWGWAPVSFPDRIALEQQSLEALSLQVMLSYFCLHGGTNFGFFGSSTWKTDHSWLTNRYWQNAPILEGGGLSDRYFAVKSASLPVANFESFFATAKTVETPITVEGPVEARALQSPQGTFVFVLPEFPVTGDKVFQAQGDGILASVERSHPSVDIASQPGVLRLPSGERIALAAGSERVLMLPYGFRLEDKTRIDYANCTFLGFNGARERRVLVFWGEAGRAGALSVNGARLDFIFESDVPVTLESGEVTVLALSSAMADRTWFADGRILIGPAYVGEPNGARHECWIDASTKPVVTVSAEGTIATVATKTQSMAAKTVTTKAVPGEMVKLSWRGSRIARPSEGWKKLDKPRSVEELGGYYGYSWYRATMRVSSPQGSGLLFTAAADRMHIWADENYLGVAGRGTADARDLLVLKTALPKSAVGTVLTFLCDNMGRSSEGSAQQKKGLFGPVYTGAKAQVLTDVPLSSVDGPLNEDWQFANFRLTGSPHGRFFEAVWKVPNDPDHGLFLALRRLTHYAWVSVNGRLIGEHHGDDSLLDGFGVSEYVLPIAGSLIEIRIRFYGTANLDLRESIRLYSYPLAGELSEWAYQPWSPPELGASALAPEPGEGPELGPVWWEAKFDRPTLPEPLFLATNGLSKGQLYLNGKPTARYWSIGPTHSAYLPGIEERNALGLLDEKGNSPLQTFIFRDGSVPTTTVIL